MAHQNLTIWDKPRTVKQKKPANVGGLVRGGKVNQSATEIPIPRPLCEWQGEPRAPPLHQPSGTLGTEQPPKSHASNTRYHSMRGKSLVGLQPTRQPLDHAAKPILKQIHYAASGKSIGRSMHRQWVSRAPPAVSNSNLTLCLRAK